MANIGSLAMVLMILIFQDDRMGATNTGGIIIGSLLMVLMIMIFEIMEWGPMIPTDTLRTK
jgi:hypothetical protein